MIKGYIQFVCNPFLGDMDVIIQIKGWEETNPNKKIIDMNHSICPCIESMQAISSIITSVWITYEEDPKYNQPD